MATTKFYLDKRAVKKDGTSPLKISLSHKGHTALISLNVYLSAVQWDEKRERVINTDKKIFLNEFIKKRKLEVDSALLRLAVNGVLANLTVSQIKYLIMQELEPIVEAQDGNFVYEFKKFMQSRIKSRTRELYSATLSRMRKFCPKLEKIRFEDITKDWLVSFDEFLARTSPSKNARNIHFRNIRAVFNSAIDNEVTAYYPFRKFKIQSMPTIKRALTVEQLRLLFNYEVEEYQEKYRDMFKLIFCLIGINAVDLLHLALNNINNGRIEYRRAKTGRMYDLKIEPEAALLIEKLHGEKYLVDVLDRYKDYRNYVKRLNDNLQMIGETFVDKRGKKCRKPLFPNITTYWARHSWATIAAELDIPKETIAAALGHGGNTVTDIYIDFDRKKVDEANRRVLDYVFYGKRQ